MATMDNLICEMLTENTGKHFLDSGGANGRNWQRNQGLTGKWCWAIESEGGADLGHGTVSCLDDALEAVREALNDE